MLNILIFLQGRTLLGRYGGSVNAILMDSFSEMFPTAEGSFVTPSPYIFIPHLKTNTEEHKAYWDRLENRQQFLTAFAAQSGFDPLKAKNWRNTMPKLRAHGVSILSFLTNDLVAYLVLLRPCGCLGNIKICKSCFLIPSRQHFRIEAQ